MKVLIIGGSIFAGKAIVKKFLEGGHEVYVLNRGTRKCMEGAIQIVADRNEPEQVLSMLENKQFDVAVDSCAYYPEQTKIILDNLKDRVKHFIHISTAAVYKESSNYTVTEDAPTGHNENWGDYSKQKYLCEQLLFEKHAQDNFPVTILRPFYLYGPENDIYRENYVFHRILRNMPIVVPILLRENKVPVIKFGHVYDLANAVVKIALNKNTYGEAYNVAGHENVSFIEWIDICAKVVCIKPKILGVDMQSITHKAREFFPFRAVHLTGTINKLSQLGINPEFSLLEGLKHTYKNTPRDLIEANPTQTEQEKELRMWKLKGII